MFFFNDTATTEIYTLSLHDALPISVVVPTGQQVAEEGCVGHDDVVGSSSRSDRPLCPVTEVTHVDPDVRRQVECRSEEHTSELQSRQYLVCRLLLEKKNNTNVFALT